VVGAETVAAAVAADTNASSTKTYDLRVASTPVDATLLLLIGVASTYSR
jgi:hypothetical protein